jgi:hypothetical protein
MSREKDTEKTVVVFRKFRKEGDIIALFPHIDDGNYRCLSYMQLGQHSGADYELVVAISVPAQPFEYEKLFRELEGIGYNLDVRLRKTRNLT